MIKTYTIRLIAVDLLADIGALSWSTRIAAPDMLSAWREFIARHQAPIYRSADLLSAPGDYDIYLDRDTLPNIIGTT